MLLMQNNKEWAIFNEIAINGCVQIIPIMDNKNHTHSLTCTCKPFTKQYKSLLIIHNSFDGREFFEFDNVNIKS